MNANYDRTGAQGLLGNRQIKKPNSSLALIGIALVAIGIGAGVWWGMSTANSQIWTTASSSGPGVAIDANQSSNSASPAITTASSMGKGEAVVAEPARSTTRPARPLSVRPPPLFDPIDALALQASQVAITPTTAQPRASIAASASATQVQQQTIQPTGWQGSGSPLLQMWDVGTQAEWAVRPVRLSPPNWRISGVVQRGEQTQAIVQFEGEAAPRFFKIGDLLPGGAKLAWVKPNVIGVVMPKSGILAVPVLGGQAPDKAPVNSQSKKP